MPEHEDFEELYHDAPVGYFTTTVDDRITRVNRRFLEWTSYDEADVVGRRFVELLDPDTVVFYETRRVPVLHQEGETREVVLRLRCKDGEVLPILLNSVLVLGPDEQPRLVRSAIFDATDRSEYERGLLAERRIAEATAARVQVLQNASVDFAGCETENEIADALGRIVGDSLGATVSYVAVVDPVGELEVVAGANPLASLDARDDPRPGLDSLQPGAPLLFAGYDEIEPEYPAVAAAMRSERLEGFAAFPLLRDHAPLGIVWAFFEQRREIEPDAISLVQALCLQATQALARIRLQEELAHLALHDQLTGLANRALLREHIDSALAASARTMQPVAMMFLDLDGFKPVNDRLGHPTGDEVLREVAERLRSMVRDSDVIGRFGGDEFIVLCPATDDEQAAVIAERLREAVGEPMEWLPAGFAVTASVGVVVHHANEHSATTDELLEIADTEMYRAKNGGRNRVSIAGR
ncbi:diguanylate cyclase [Pseudolysinimonas sp.]|uniref:diguanylate cyclase n=1 Tax=Pseudolysinimonas sp. TaxID=2680009 RepID=UPI00286AE02C|nr:diguanylate cyclase [Pseudolysinimonas sp.]